MEDEVKWEDLPIRRVQVDQNDLPIWRDADNEFKPVETLFGTIDGGCGFGENALFNIKDHQQRFYSTIAVTDCFCISIGKKQVK